MPATNHRHRVKLGPRLQGHIELGGIAYRSHLLLDSRPGFSKPPVLQRVLELPQPLPLLLVFRPLRRWWRDLLNGVLQAPQGLIGPDRGLFHLVPGSFTNERQQLPMVFPTVQGPAPQDQKGVRPPGTVPAVPKKPAGERITAGPARPEAPGTVPRRAASPNTNHLKALVDPGGKGLDQRQMIAQGDIIPDRRMLAGRRPPIASR